MAGPPYERYIIGENEYGGYTKAKVSASGHVAEIEYAHRAAHEDGFCFASYYSTGVGTTAPLVILVKPSTAYSIHSHFDVMASGGALMQIHERASTSVTTEGTVLTVCRVNRSSTIGDTDRPFTWHTPTLSSAGTLLLTQHNAGTTARGPQTSIIGGGTRSGEEFILPKSGDPLTITVTPDADATKVGVVHAYYEV